MRLPIRVSMVYRYRLLSEVVAGLLRKQAEIHLHSTHDPEGTLEWFRSAEVDLVLLDASQKKPADLRLTRRLKEQRSDLKVVPFGLDHEKQALEFIEAGASGYVLRDASCAELLHTIQVVHRDDAHCSRRMAAVVFKRIAELAQELHMKSPQHRDPDLTPREKQVLELMASGLSNKEIARHLDLRVPTVKNHVHNVLDKFQVHRRREAIRLAYETGLLEGPLPFPPPRHAVSQSKAARSDPAW